MVGQTFLSVSRYVGESLAEGAPWRMGSRGRVRDPPLHDVSVGWALDDEFKERR